jgi:hypothetical protein
MDLVHLVAIEEHNQTFTADIYLYNEWNDPRLAYSAPEGAYPRTYTGDQCKKMLEEIWSPDIEFVNSGVPDYSNNTLTIFPEGKVALAQGFTGIFRNPFNFRKLPFDKQTLLVVLSSFSWDKQVVVFNVDPREIQFQKKLSLAFEELKVEDIRGNVVTDTIDEDGKPNQYSEFIFSVTIKRDPFYFLFQVFFPLLVVIGLCCSVFYIPPESITNRIPIAITCVLVFIATKFLLNKDLPEIGYLTFIDKVFLISYLFAGLVAVTCIIEYLYWEKKDPMADKINIYARIFAPIVYVAACLLLYLFEIVY